MAITNKKTKSQKIGDRGEHRVSDCLKSFIPENQIINDIILTNFDTVTSQIDHIAVTNAGVFVIEVKNYCADKIFCNPDWKYWYYLLPGKHKTTEKFTFYNPIWQNATHVSIIDKLLNYSIPIYSIIVFSKDNPLAFVDSKRPNTVVSIFKLQKYIQSFEPTIQDSDIKNIIKVILSNKRTDVTLAQHIDNIQQIKENG